MDTHDFWLALYHMRWHLLIVMVALILGLVYAPGRKKD